MDVSNSTGQSTQYSVKGTGGTAPVPGKKLPPRRAVAKTLPARTFTRVKPPYGTSWIIEFRRKTKVLASVQTEDPECLVVLVEESDGSFKAHVSCSAEAAFSRDAPAESPHKLSA